MKTLPLFIAAAVCALVAACTLNPITGNPFGAPVQSHGLTLENGCVVDAIACCTELKGSGADPKILLVRYTKGEQTFGHAMTVYSWPPEGQPWSRVYVYDRVNASMLLPLSVNGQSALAVGKYMIPTTSAAYWTDPTGLKP